jgi:hypothetical protein
LYSVSCPGCTVLTVFSGCPGLVLSHPSCPIFLSYLSSTSCPAPSLLSPAHLSSQFGPCCPVLASRPLCPVLPDPSKLSCYANLSKLTCLGFPVQRHQCHQMSCLNHTVIAVLPWLSHLSSPVLAALSFSHVLAILASLSCPACTIHTFFGCPVLAVLSKISCRSCPSPALLSLALLHVFIALCYLLCPTCPVHKILY